MAEHSKIEWTDATWNPITGCSVVSPGCTNCYAMKLAGTRLQHHPSRAGLTRDSKAGPVWTGEVRLNEQWLDQPLRWQRPRRIFVCAHGDLFHEAVPDAWIDRVFAVMVLAPQHTFQVLTKRAKRMREYVVDKQKGYGVRPGHYTDHHSHIWLGVSAEDQARADERRDDLGPLARRYGCRTFVSYEPALGLVDWTGWEFLDWLISGGESGPGARPSHPYWHRAARDFCAEYGIAYHFKQWGAWGPSAMTATISAGTSIPIAWPDGTISGGEAGNHGGVGVRMIKRPKKYHGRLLDGIEHNAMPEVRP